ncbi:hypothetical protein GCM10010525_30150 [Glutamicibacter bergerei]|uniref:Uncharacterized protein n=1 Tax=Glutamicibacter ardleyensis TaxID=225894 RepID=A0ABQ2DMD2_9MICC|nr:hypothetical protein GCM10007173_23420 [Glutamicibacter ardleyensis]
MTISSKWDDVATTVLFTEVACLSKRTLRCAVIADLARREVRNTLETFYAINAENVR